MRSNLTEADPARLWQQYIRLTKIEQAFKALKSEPQSPTDLPPTRSSHRSLHSCRLQRLLSAGDPHLPVQFLAPGLALRIILEKVSAIHMIDVHLLTTDGGQIVLSRSTQLEADQQLLLQQLKLTLPRSHSRVFEPVRLPTSSHPQMRCSADLVGSIVSRSIGPLAKTVQ